MNTMFREMLHTVRAALCVFAALVFLLTASRPASAQWDAANTKAAWEGYNTAFKYAPYPPPNNNDEYYYTEIGTAPWPNADKWQQAEQIEMAEDAYWWATTNDSSELTYYEQVVESLCDGFVGTYGDTWTSDLANDDLDVMIIAFTRAYNITGTTRWLNDAESNYTTVWNRAQGEHGGLCENSVYNEALDEYDCPVPDYENSSANWGFVIASYFLYNKTGDATYANNGASIYSWAYQHLYNSSAGEIYDAWGPTRGQYSYNYGFAIGAATLYGDTSLTNGAGYYIMHDFTAALGKPYAGTRNGYNILPNYKPQGATDNDGGYNGIVLRWMNYANNNNFLTQLGGFVAWAQANVSQAWANREYSDSYPYYLMWDDWGTTSEDLTPNNTIDVYSWDCSSAVVGMLDTPAPD